MKELKNIFVIGAGAMGLPVALKLAALPRTDVRVIADGERVARYRRDGLFFNGERCELAYAAPTEVAGISPDLVIVATKNGALPQVAQLLQQCSLRDSLILPILNGISARDFFCEKFPSQQTLYGLYLGHASVREGNSVTFDGCGKICFGESVNRPPCENVAAVAGLFDEAGIAYDVPQDMMQVMWAKYVLNIGINQAQAYFRADYGMVQQDAEMLEFAKKLMAEAVAVAEVSGISGCDLMIGKALDIIMSMPPRVKTSMLQDVEAGRATEVDAFAGTLCRMADAAGIPVPCNRMILDHFTKI